MSKRRISDTDPIVSRSDSDAQAQDPWASEIDHAIERIGERFLANLHDLSNELGRTVTNTRREEESFEARLRGTPYQPAPPASLTYSVVPSIPWWRRRWVWLFAVVLALLVAISIVGVFYPLSASQLPYLGSDEAATVRGPTEVHNQSADAGKDASPPDQSVDRQDSAPPVASPTPDHASLSVSAPSATPMTETVTTDPIFETPSVADLVNLVSTAEADLKSGQIQAKLDYAGGSHSTTTITFDLGGEGRDARFHMTTVYQGSDETITTEHVTIGDRAWQKRPDGTWHEGTEAEGVWGRIQGFLPRIQEVTTDIAIDRSSDSPVLTWYDDNAVVDVTLLIDAVTGVPQELRTVSRATGSTLTVTYSGWNSAVEIIDPTT